MDIQELEARFEEIDQRSDSEPVQVNLAGDAESSGTLNVTVKRKVRATEVDGEAPNTPAPAESISVPSETLLDVNLADVEIPDEYIERAIHKVFSNRETVGVLAQPVLEQVGATRKWELKQDYSYAVGGNTITALSRFVYDRASIPPIFWPLVDRDNVSSVAPLFHDLLYRYGGALPENQVPPRDGTVTPYRTFQRKEVDDLFLELMRKSDVKPWRAQAAYRAVRTVSGLFWKD